MDIQVSSNFERALFWAYGSDPAAIRQIMDELKAGGFTISQGALQALQDDFTSGRASEDETLDMIRTTRAETGEILCPHSAVGVKVAREHLRDGVPMITLATALSGEIPRCGGKGRRDPPRSAAAYGRAVRQARTPDPY